MAAVFLSASETHNRKNLNCGIAEQLGRIRPVAERARADGVALRAYVSTVCGCPYEGAVAISAVTDLVQKLHALGVAEISLGDTIGVGVPSGLRALVAAVADVAPLDGIALHLHDTYGRALANVEAGYQAGVRTFDASLGGWVAAPMRPARRATSRPRTWSICSSAAGSPRASRSTRSSTRAPGSRIAC
jgi:hydroxymethylglutaryl-CoA lyase